MWLDTASAKSFEELSRLAKSPVYVFEGDALVKVFGEVPFFQQVLDRRKFSVSVSGNSLNVCSFARAVVDKFVFVMGPFRSAPSYDDEELSAYFEKLPIFNNRYQLLLDFAVASVKRCAEREVSDAGFLQTQALLLDFLHSVIGCRDLNSLVSRAAEFFVHKFRLSNAFISAFDVSYRHFNSSPVYSEVESVILKQVSDSRTSFRVADLSGDVLFRHIEHLSSVPRSLVAYPLLVDRHFFGSVLLYCDCLPCLDVVPDLVRELASLLVQVSDFERVKTSASIDSLTGLSNRRHFVPVFDAMIDRLRKGGLPVTVLIFDVDDFKKFNDLRGHPEGDRVLVSVSEITRRISPASALSCRYGGEEFVIVVPEISQQGAVEFAESLRLAVEKETELTISIGLINCLNSSASRITLIKEADKALYQAKRLGKNRVVAFVMADKGLGVIDTTGL